MAFGHFAKRAGGIAAALLVSCSLASLARAAGAEVVAGPAADPQ